MHLIIHGHCYSGKNSRQMACIRGRSGKLKYFPAKRQVVKSFEEKAILQLKAQWGGKPPFREPRSISMRVYYAGPTPDDLGPAEEVYDLLQKAGVVENDRLLRLWGQPAIALIRVERSAERVEIELNDYTLLLEEEAKKSPGRDQEEPCRPWQIGKRK